MITKIVKPRKHGLKFSWGQLLWFAVGFFLLAGELYAQDVYEISTRQRRLGDQIGVEFWIKSLTTDAPNLGNASISVVYNTDFLAPEGNQAYESTDSVDVDINQTDAYTTFTSPFSDVTYGYTSALGASPADAEQGGNHVYTYQIDVNLDMGGIGYQPSSSGRGSFAGMLKFDIQDHANLTCTDLTEIAFNTADFVSTIEITDADGNNVTDQVSFVAPEDFVIRGITILNPNGGTQAINRYPDPAYASISPNQGYPVYFERSGIINTGTYDYGESSVAYLLEYSLNGGSSWSTIGRVAETVNDETAMGANVANYVSGEIDVVSSTSEYYITDGDGDPLIVNYSGVIRVIWENSENFPYRSENGKIRISQIAETDTDEAITTRAAYTDDCRRDESDETFVLGRLFFVQLDGTSSYFRTASNYSQATQLTVMAWVNLNSVNEDGEPAIVANSAGPAEGAAEGAWMLYLADGQYPAFRARENEGRGPSGYIGMVQSQTALSTTSDASPIQDAHANNWVHIAATVSNNVVSLYVNGEMVDEYTNNYAVDPRLLVTNHPIWIGVNPNDEIEEDDYLHAGIKEATVWRYALSQDEIRQNIGGVYDPAGDVASINPVNGDERAGLELYYTFQGIRTDVADDTDYQNGATVLNYFEDPSLSASAVNNNINYRPDRSHITITSPIGGEGVRNVDDVVYEVRWAGYGLGSTAPDTDDIMVQFSRDGGANYYDANDNQVPSVALTNVEIEDGYATWEPYNNVTITGQDDDLQGLVPIGTNYSKTVKLKVSGTTDRGQEDIESMSGDFTVAPYFALKNTGGAFVEVPSNTELNLSGATGFIEAWIKPYRFPTEDEEYFAIVSKKDSTMTGDSLHYALRLLADGTIQFAVGSPAGITTASSDADYSLKRPNLLRMDSVWTHVGVWFNLGNGNDNDVRFYIDGEVQTGQEFSSTTGVAPDVQNNYPSYIGYEPSDEEGTDSHGFVGELREVRFWNNNPANMKSTGNEPTEMTEFIQGALTIRADELALLGGTNYSKYLVAAYSMNGGAFVNSGIKNSIPVYPVDDDLVGRVKNGTLSYVATKPLLKLIKPEYEQAVPNTEDDLQVRWVGFDYNRNDAASTFINGSGGATHADLEYSVLGGGGMIIQPYQAVTSEAYSVAYPNAMTLPTGNNSFEFPGTSSKSQFSARLDVSAADPDLNNDGVYNDYGQIAATMTNGRLRLQGRSTINGTTFEYENGTNGDMPTLRTESDLFNITPPSNFTVRVLLEGYHTGLAGAIQNDIGSTYDNNGIRIKLYSDNANTPGVLIAEAESTNGYSNDATALDPTAGVGRGADGSEFANVPFVFTEISDNDYFVVVEHLNHLPIMSAYAAPFYYSGDDVSTWVVESGWDFQTWDGVVDNIITDAEASTTPPSYGTKYTAWGNAETDPAQTAYAATGLIFNNGQAGGSANAIAAMVGGDVYKDGQINAADRAQVRADIGGSNMSSDVTGDGNIDADDRTIVDRNTNKVSSLTNLSVINKFDDGTVEESPILDYLVSDDPMTVVHPEYPEYSEMFIRGAENYLANGGEYHHDGLRVEKYAKDVVLSNVSYEVSARTRVNRNNNTIEIPFYIKNTGELFALANATFAIDYDPASLKFESLIKEQTVIFDNDGEGYNDLGYGKLATGPTKNTVDPIPNIRTIEIMYDAYTEGPGQNVPSDYTYIGTLVFKVIRPQEMYTFNWYNESVHTVDGRIVTGDGTFLDIPPAYWGKDANITAPNGGETWRAGKSNTIQWATNGTVSGNVYLEFSLDAGKTWDRINPNPVDINSRSYRWVTPQVTSTECLVRMVDAEGNLEIDRSDATFVLEPAPVEITRPSAGDPVYKGATDDHIIWSYDEAVSVRFEFSENGLDAWTPVTGIVNAKEGQTKWTVPAINTKQAAVRMVNATTNEVLTTSSQFRILAGDVTITHPQAGEVLNSGKEKAIRWTKSNVDRFDLQWSADGGQTWQSISKDIPAAVKSFGWAVPEHKTDEAIVRAIWNNDPQMEYSRSGMFSIDGKVGVEDLHKLGYIFDEPVPNPFSEVAELSFTIPVTQSVTVDVLNQAGQRMMRLIDGATYSAGTHSFQLSGSDLPSGMYIIILRTGSYTMTQEVVLIK
ncbi:MAG: LamG-like jellyroll fold domain-containing protein [Candidatus Kapaibacterium sp.]